MNSLGKKIVYIYIAVIFTSAIIFGTLINLFLDPASIPNQLAHNHSHNFFWDWFSNISIYMMLAITWFSLLKKDKKMNLDNNADLILIIKGMTCNHCKKTATEAIESCNGVENVNIDLETGKTFIFGKTIDFSEIEDSINSVGFSSSKFS